MAVELDARLPRLFRLRLAKVGEAFCLTFRRRKRRVIKRALWDRQGAPGLPPPAQHPCAHRYWPDRKTTSHRLSRRCRRVRRSVIGKDLSKIYLRDRRVSRAGLKTGCVGQRGNNISMSTPVPPFSRCRQVFYFLDLGAVFSSHGRVASDILDVGAGRIRISFASVFGAVASPLALAAASHFIIYLHARFLVVNVAVIPPELFDVNVPVWCNRGQPWC